ncbi:hypothetical protein EV360DRAFT_80841 [Lentinula raphanica]|nr:hypothetical protein EV360DRAFT_80841 [Lentinula raphanica]
MSSTSSIPGEVIVVSDHPLFKHGNVTFRSSDGIVFRIDQWRLEFMASGFPLDISCRPDEVVALDEDSRSLEILFTFLYPDRDIPDIGALPFDKLVKLLKAADKYAFLPALELSLSHLQKYVQTWPLRIFTLAGMHNNSTLLAALAPHLANVTPAVIETVGFSTDLCAKWKAYRDNWDKTIRASKELLNDHGNQCCFWRNCIHPYLITKISESPVGSIHRLVKGTKMNSQKGLWEIYENVMERLEIEMIANGDGERGCCKYELRKWFDHVADELRGIRF